MIAPKPICAKAEEYFERALAVARAQQAKSWELRAAMSMARLWRDQGKPRRKLANSSLRFTAGLPKASTHVDLKEAKALLDELNALRQSRGSVEIAGQA